MTSRYEFPISEAFDSDDQAFLFDVHKVEDKTGEERVRVTWEQIKYMRERRRLSAQAEAQRRSSAAQPSVPFYLGRTGINLSHREYRAGP